MLPASASRPRPSGAREPVAIVVGNVERWVGVCRVPSSWWRRSWARHASRRQPFGLAGR
jgi:hypothetical protein